MYQVYQMKLPDVCLPSLRPAFDSSLGSHAGYLFLTDLSLLQAANRRQIYPPAHVFIQIIIFIHFATCYSRKPPFGF